MKKCSTCEKEKDLKEFVKRKTSKDGRRGVCKPCSNVKQKERIDKIRKDYNTKTRDQYDHEKEQKRNKKRKEYLTNNRLIRTFDITLEDYNNMLSDQNNCCKICHKECKSGKSLAVDHCHTTGQVRGLLCMKCNTALGNFNDNTELLKAAIKYLGEYNVSKL